MIKELQPLDMKETAKILKGIEDSEKKAQIESFIKKFSKIDVKKADKIREELKNLEFLKIKPEHIVKIIDALPEDTSDLNKIFTETSLTEDETNKILEIIKSK